MRLAYVADPYRSHRRSAHDNAAALLAAGHVLVDRLEHADACIVHIDWERIPHVHTAYPQLQSKPWAAYFCWETSEPPDSVVAYLRSARAVWTPSRYSADIFAKHHDNVEIIPNTLPLARLSPSLVAQAASITWKTSDTFVFFAIGKLRDRRKGLDVVLDAFARVNAIEPRARLVIKGDEADPKLRRPSVTQIRQAFPDRMLQAMYGAVDAYVSAHRAESWGYTISDAIAHGVPAIATSYSANLEFMNPETSWLVKATPVPTGLEAMPGLWGEPDVQDLADKMLEVMRLGAEAKVRAARAQAELQLRFSREVLSAAINQAVARLLA